MNRLFSKILSQKRGEFGCLVTVFQGVLQQSLPKGLSNGRPIPAVAGCGQVREIQGRHSGHFQGNYGGVQKEPGLLRSLLRRYAWEEFGHLW